MKTIRNFQIFNNLIFCNFQILISINPVDACDVSVVYIKILSNDFFHKYEDTLHD